jgi:mRNA-degrading endonuclease toxin of MazEF toxin-antitoxin module
MFWCVPLSTKQKKFDFYFNFTNLNDQKVSVILAQLKLTSIKRLQRKLYEMQPDTLKEMKEKMREFMR